jgi:hypothetical protein
VCSGTDRLEVTLPQEYLVGALCTFQCRGCGFRSPLDSLRADGGAVCLKCGLHQAFSVDSWPAVLEVGHAAADLCGPEPEGREQHDAWSIAGFNPYADVGVTRTTVTREAHGVQDGVKRSLRAVLGPGHPVCSDCGAPVEVAVPAPGSVLTACASCGDTAEYHLDDQALALHEALVGVIAAQHRVDKDDASIDAANTFHCSSCAGPLEVDGAARLVTCPFCSSVSRIPAEKLQGLDQPPPPDHWWWVFAGSSATRRQLLDGMDEPQKVTAPPRASGGGVGSIPRMGMRLAGPALAATIGLVVAAAVAAAVYGL